MLEEGGENEPEASCHCPISSTAMIYEEGCVWS